MVPEVNVNSKPSSSTSYSTITDKNLQNTDDFENDFSLNPDDLAAIDNLNAPDKRISPPPPTTTTTKTTTTSTTVFSKNVPRSSVTRPTHFTTKSPINVYFKKIDDQPPEKRSRFSSHETFAEQGKKLNSDSTPDPFNTYNNCTFNGNIINNFYCSCAQKNYNEKENV